MGAFNGDNKPTGPSFEEPISLTIEPYNGEGEMVEMSMSIDADQSITPGRFYWLMFTDDDENRYRMTEREAGQLYERLGEMLGRRDPATAKVLDDLAAERARQIAGGYNRTHDSYHTTHALVTLAEKRLHRTPPRKEDGYYYREALVEGAAMVVAAIEAMDARGDGH